MLGGAFREREVPRITRRLACAALLLAGLAACSSARVAMAPATTTTTISSVTSTTATVSSTVSSTVVVAPASGPPHFLWGYGDPLLCGSPRPAETLEAVDANRRLAPLALSASARHERILLVGDSTACSLWPGLNAAADSVGIATDQGVVFGCGIASDEFTTTRNESITPHSERCPVLVDWAERRALVRARPTVVIWMSVWEKSDLVVGGRTIVADTPQWETTIMSRMDAALARLTAGGARVAVVTQAAPAPNPAQRTETTDRKADDAGYVRLDRLLRMFRSRHPGTVTRVDLAAQLCPRGPPCPAFVAGTQTRPDGRHFTPAAATWAARWLLSQLFPSRTMNLPLRS
jgi:hypothetical protein